MSHFFSIRRSGFWNGVSDFLADKNGTLNFRIEVSPMIGMVCSSCGPSPDVVAMANEQVSMSDIAADNQGLFGKDRIVFKELFELCRAASRVSWMGQQISESNRTNSAPFEAMSSVEQHTLIKEISARRNFPNKQTTKNTTTL